MDHNNRNRQHSPLQGNRHTSLWARLEEGRGSQRILPPTPPALPSPKLPRQPGPIAPPGDSGRERPPVDRLPVGPFDPRGPLPWDRHLYPDPARPSDIVYDAHGASYNATKLISDALKKLLPGDRDDDRPDRPALPPPGRDRPALPPPGRDRPALPPPSRPALPPPSRPALPASVARANEERRAAALELLKTPVESGLVSANPLDLLDDYLRSQGIRHFSAWEVTQHKWRHARGRIAPPISGRRSSAWSHVYDLLPPEYFPRGVHFLLPRCVVPHPDLWPSILPALWVLDRFREWLGEPVNAISGYRCPWYNTQIEGSDSSFHMAFAAVDFTYDRQRNGHLDTGVFVDWFERLYRKQGDGVGRYGSRFIHLDVGMDRHKLREKSENWWRPRELRGVLP